MTVSGLRPCRQTAKSPFLCSAERAVSPSRPALRRAPRAAAVEPGRQATAGGGAQRARRPRARCDAEGWRGPLLPRGERQRGMLRPRRRPAQHQLRRRPLSQAPRRRPPRLQWRSFSLGCTAGDLGLHYAQPGRAVWGRGPDRGRSSRVPRFSQGLRDGPEFAACTYAKRLMDGLRKTPPGWMGSRRSRSGIETVSMPEVHKNA